MDIIKTFTCLLFFIIASEHIDSQVIFDSKSKQTGTIQSNGDILKINYTFKNESAQPVAIARIVSSCGCTIPSFEKRPIQAGQQGKIVVSFNPVGINGFFKKQISVYFSNSKQPVHLYLSGEVISTQNLEPGYHYAIGPLQFRNIRSSLKASAGQTTMRAFLILNTSNTSTTVSLSSNLKDIFFEEEHFTLSPKEQKELIVYFSPKTSRTIRIRITKEEANKQKIALKVVPDL